MGSGVTEEAGGGTGLESTAGWETGNMAAGAGGAAWTGSWAGKVREGGAPEYEKWRPSSVGTDMTSMLSEDTRSNRRAQPLRRRVGSLRLLLCRAG